MSDLYLNPQEFQGQIDAFKLGTETIKELKYNLEAESVRLQSIDKYLECVAEFNKTIELFGQLLTQDTESMKLIKAKWMNLDNDIATKTLGEILFGSANE